MSNLARDISKNLPDTFSGNMDDMNANNDTQVVQQKNDGIMSFIPKVLREPLLIFILYIILSQPFVINGVGRYIKQVQPDSSGRFSMAGIVIYGLIFAVLYMLFKRLLIE
jgi:hypothetical protein